MLNKKHLLLYLIISIFSIGIGYAEIGNIDLSIEGEASLDRQEGVVITSIEYVDGVSVNPNSSIINTFYQTFIWFFLSVCLRSILFLDQPEEPRREKKISSLPKLA